MTTTAPLAASAARKLLRQGNAPADMHFSGHLRCDPTDPPQHLPAGLRGPSLDLTGCTWLTALPERLEIDHLIVDDCVALAALSTGLRCVELLAQRTRLHALPADLRVRCRLDLSGCRHLTHLPAQLDVQELLIGGCPLLRELPTDLRVRGWLDLTDTALRRLPTGLQGVRLRWRNVFVDHRIVFAPQTITADEVLTERNAERRRVLMERMGFERFFAATQAEELDADMDRGGPRRLLRVELDEDEAVVVLAVRCPSTGRDYLLRVPPDLPTCRHAAAWLAGFENPDDYHPLVET